jgi:hypothetical protein
MVDLRQTIRTTIRYFLNENRLRNINEGYDHVSIEYIKNKHKLSDYYNYDDKIVIKNNTYLNFTEKEGEEDEYEWFLYGTIYVFDNEDETEIANATYGKIKEYSDMKSTIGVRGDKRRQGIASNIYQWIEKLTGYKLHPDTPHSKAAEQFWNNPNREFGFDK